MSPFASLRSRLFLVVAAAITPFVLYAVLMATRERSIATAAVRARSQALSRATARQMDDRLKTVDRLVELAMARVRWPASSRTPLMTADSLGEPLASGLAIGVLDTSGTRIGVLMGDGARLDALPRDRRRAIIASAVGTTTRRSREAVRSTLVDEGLTRAANDAAALVIVRALVRPPGGCNCLADTPGALVAVLDDHTIQAMLAADSLPDGGVALLVGTSGVPIGRPAAPDRWIAPASQDSATLALGGPRDGQLALTGTDGVTRAVGYTTLTKLPWRVYVGVPNTPVAAGADQLMRDTLMLAALALLIAAVGSIVASRAYSAPLVTLAADTKRLAAGVLTHRSETAGRGGEIGAMGAALNALAETLETEARSTGDLLRRAQRIFDDSPVPMWITDASTSGATAGRIQQANRAADLLFGVEAGALVGQRENQLLDASVRLLAVPTPAEGNVAHHGTARLRSAAAAGREFDVTVSYPDPTRQAIRIVALLEKAVPAPPSQVAPAIAPELDTRAPHDAVVAFAGQVADDVADLLHGIAGFTQLAADSVDDPDMSTIAIDRIRDLAHRGLAMARQLQAYGRRDVLQPQQLDLNETVSDVAQAMADTLGRHVELEVLFNVQPAHVVADPALVHHVLAVLVANARDAMPAGGTLTLATTPIEVPRISAEPCVAPPGQYVVLTVADTGMGMTRDAQQHMFEPFYSTKRARQQGAGLGLASVDGIATEHGWWIGVESEPAVGTAISLYIPAAPASVDAAPAGDQSSFETVPARST